MWCWSLRRLYRAKQLRAVRKVKAVDEKDKGVIEKEESVWWDSLMVNGAYMPLSVSLVE